MGKLKTAVDLLLRNRRAFANVFICYLAKNKISHLISDKTFIKIRYWGTFGRAIDLQHPKTFNEKLNWLKLYARDNKFVKMVDKFEAKELVRNKLGDSFIAKTINVYDNVDEIDISKLPDKFVLKCTHDSGSVIVCSDKNKFNMLAAKKKLSACLKHNLFWWGREWPYKNVKPRIIAEEYLHDDVNENLPVYKFLCFNGVPTIIQTIQNDKHPNESIDYFSPEWELLDMRQDYPNSEYPLSKPALLDEMLRLASILSKGFPFLRIDFFTVNNAVKFSEFTFYSDCGFASFEPQIWDLKLGELINI